jgi:hypothetical protein
MVICEVDCGKVDAAKIERCARKTTMGRGVIAEDEQARADEEPRTTAANQRSIMMCFVVIGCSPGKKKEDLNVNKTLDNEHKVLL